jgi:hypothetical protein
MGLSFPDWLTPAFQVEITRASSSHWVVEKIVCIYAIYAHIFWEDVSMAASTQGPEDTRTLLRYTEARTEKR